MVGQEGLEPPKAMPTDLQSAPFDHFGTDPHNSQKNNRYKILYAKQCTNI